MEKSYYYLWAKANRKTHEIHRLIYHLIDVRQTALAVWQIALNDTIKQETANWLHLNIDDAGQVIGFWASLHDLGKASPAFQNHPSMPCKLREQIVRDLEAVGFKFPARSRGESRSRHETITAIALSEDGLLAQFAKLPEGLISKLSQSLGGHHGTWPASTTLNAIKPDDKGGEEWANARREIIEDLIALWQPPQIATFQPDEQNDNVLFTMISGIISIADWFGSDEKNFPYEDFILPLNVYARHAEQHALCALLRADWKRVPKIPSFDFSHAFGFLPREAQQQVCDQLENVSLPALAIIEAPMGSGKTEAALAVYAMWAKAGGQGGLYIAMPTTATSNQMHGRVTDFLSKQFGREIEPLLVHSQALLQNPPEESDSVEEDDKEGDYARAQEWFLPRKKSLLAPFGVGTVDQVFMSVLQTKHFFIRLLGLHHKIVIFDEVHGYDAYMSELFKQLLIWLRELGASVIILSATLPTKTRLGLIQAFTDNSATPPKRKYPRLTFITANGQPESIELTPPDNKILDFDWLERDATDDNNIIRCLKADLQPGGCAIVICNTVGRAQKLYQTLRQSDVPLCEDDNLILFHARFPLAWREGIEEKVLAKFGPNSIDKALPNPNRPHKAIVVATQVVEQSLDLDFDLMISDHAPIDLLLQRAGRLHRHKINDMKRKQPFKLLITIPKIDDGLPKFERSDKKVYDEYILLRSWLTLQANTDRKIHMPSDLDILIEDTYGDHEPTVATNVHVILEKAKQEMIKEQFDLKRDARTRIIPKPDNDRLLWAKNETLEEDNPVIHKTFLALTRSDRPGVNVVCLHRIGNQLLLEPDKPDSVYDLSIKLERTMIRELARHTVNIRHFDPEVEQSLLAESEESEIKAILSHWKKVASLRYHRVVIFEAGACPLKGTSYMIKLNKEDKLGLKIE